MITQRQNYLENAVLSVLLLLTTVAQSAMLTNDLLTTSSPAQSSLTTQPDNTTVEEPLALGSHRPCRSEHEAFCENGGQCMYPQDSDEPSCICPSSYTGRRCLFFSTHARTVTVTEMNVDKLIGISFGTAMFIVVLAIVTYCFAYKRCVKSAPLIKSAPSELSV